MSLTRQQLRRAGREEMRSQLKSKFPWMTRKQIRETVSHVEKEAWKARDRVKIANMVAK